MFFRRERPKVLTFEDHMSAARAAGFRVESVGSGRLVSNAMASPRFLSPDRMVSLELLSAPES